MWAVTGFPRIEEFLLNPSIDCNTQLGFNPLHVAAIMGYTIFAKLLLKKEAIKQVITNGKANS